MQRSLGQFWIIFFVLLVCFFVSRFIVDAVLQILNSSNSVPNVEKRNNFSTVFLVVLSAKIGTYDQLNL